MELYLVDEFFSRPAELMNGIGASFIVNDWCWMRPPQAGKILSSSRGGQPSSRETAVAIFPFECGALSCEVPLRNPSPEGRGRPPCCYPPSPKALHNSGTQGARAPDPHHRKICCWVRASSAISQPRRLTNIGDTGLGVGDKGISGALSALLDDTVPGSRELEDVW
jgi:hypothetical protein